MQCSSAPPVVPLPGSLQHPSAIPVALSPSRAPPPIPLQIVTVKNRYVILNETGFAIEYKQCGSPDPGMQAVRPTPLCIG